MGYLSGLVNSSFKKTGNDKAIFYPYGILGSGFAVSRDRETKIKKFLKVYYAVSSAVLILIVVFFGSRALWLLFLGLPLYYIKIRDLLKGAEKTQERTSFGEQAERAAAANGMFVNLIFLSGSILTTGVSIFLLFLPDHKAKYAGILGTVFSGVCLPFSVALVKYSIKAQKRKISDD